MATMTRAAVTVTAKDILGWSMTRPGRTVVHAILGDPEPDVTAREPGLRAGSLRLLFTTESAAQAAADALAVPGGPWAVDGTQVEMTAQVTGDITVAAETDAGAAWTVLVAVQEVAP